MFINLKQYGIQIGKNKNKKPIKQEIDWQTKRMSVDMFTTKHDFIKYLKGLLLNEQESKQQQKKRNENTKTKMFKYHAKQKCQNFYC